MIERFAAEKLPIIRDVERLHLAVKVTISYSVDGRESVLTASASFGHAKSDSTPPSLQTRHIQCRTMSG